MHVLYKITYIPHLNTDYPKYYIGSKYNWKPGYFGSISSKRVFEYTNGHTLKEWWKEETKTPSNFIVEIVMSFANITPNELVQHERLLQEQLNVLSCEYFNQCLAIRGFVSSKKDVETKRLLSESTKRFWESEQGQLKRQRLIERNRLTKSDEIKRKWQSDPDFARRAIEASKRPNKPEHNRKIREAKLQQIDYKGNVYWGWDDLQTQTGVTKFLYRKYYLQGFDPEVNIGIRHNPKLIPLKEMR